MMSAEDAQVVTLVLSKREDYYAVLHITKTATIEEVKRSYKKMALRLHPDKNKHPKAEEAFKVVSAAHSTLSDAQKRQTYDNYGAKGVQAQEGGQNPAAAAGHHFGGGRGRGFHGFQGGGGEAELFEELFGMFLDPRMQQRRRAQQQAQQREYYQQQQAGARAGGAAGGARAANGGVHMEFNGNPILAFLPFILFFIFALLLQSSAFTTDSSSANGGGGWGSNRVSHDRAVKRSMFGLSRTTDHFSERVTSQLPEDLSDLQVPYFVGRDFETMLQRYGLKLRSVEMEVVRTKKESLERRCNADVQRGVYQSRSVACQDLHKYRLVR